MSAIVRTTDPSRTLPHVRDVPTGDMLAKARIRANAQWSFVCVRKRQSAVNLSRAALDKTSCHRRDGGACRADRATPIVVSHADRPNPAGPSRARFAAVDGGRRCCGAA